MFWMAAILKSKMAADKRKSQPGKLLIMIPKIRRNILIPLASFHPKCLAQPVFWISAPDYGPMPNVVAALLNIGGALCSTPQSLADAHY